MKNFRPKIVPFDSLSKRHNVFTHLRGYWHFTPFKYRYIKRFDVPDFDSNGQYFIHF